jgi:hypothetical protein
LAGAAIILRWYRRAWPEKLAGRKFYYRFFIGAVQHRSRLPVMPAPALGFFYEIFLEIDVGAQ